MRGRSTFGVEKGILGAADCGVGALIASRVLVAELKKSVIQVTCNPEFEELGDKAISILALYRGKRCCSKLWCVGKVRSGCVLAKNWR